MARDDLDLRWDTGEARPTRTERPRGRMTRDEAARRRRVTVAVLAAFAVVSAFSLGRCSGLDDGERVAREAVTEATEAQNIAEVAIAERDYWQAEATDASSTISTLRADLARAEARIERYEREAEEASGAVETTVTGN